MIAQFPIQSQALFQERSGSLIVALRLHLNSQVIEREGDALRADRASLEGAAWEIEERHVHGGAIDVELPLHGAVRAGHLEAAHVDEARPD